MIAPKRWKEIEAWRDRVRGMQESLGTDSAGDPTQITLDLYDEVKRLRLELSQQTIWGNVSKKALEFACENRPVLIQRYIDLGKDALRKEFS